MVVCTTRRDTEGEDSQFITFLKTVKPKDKHGRRSSKRIPESLCTVVESMAVSHVVRVQEVRRNQWAHGRMNRMRLLTLYFSGGPGTSEQHTMSSRITLTPSYAPLWFGRCPCSVPLTISVSSLSCELIIFRNYIPVMFSPSVPNTVSIPWQQLPFAELDCTKRGDLKIKKLTSLEGRAVKWNLHLDLLCVLKTQHCQLIMYLQLFLEFQRH